MEQAATTPLAGLVTTLGLSPRQAACMVCRRSKTRCNRDPGDTKCRRCQQTDVECVTPSFHVGRRKGIKNKRTGLDKAVHRIEQALEKSQVAAATSSRLEDEQVALHLQQLLSKTQGLQGFLPASSAAPAMQTQVLSSESQGQASTFSRNASGASFGTVTRSGHGGGGVTIGGGVDDGYALEDAENPLQLLARASDLPVSPVRVSPSAHDPFSALPTPAQSRFVGGQSQAEDQDLRTFFGPLRPNLDTGQDIDPIDIGFVTPSEADVLFNFFYQNLSHTRWGLDPAIHTVHFVRSRSSFLFTSVLAASALFLPSTAALSRRLSDHRQNLSRRVINTRNRSPEIVLAFMVNIPWMSPGRHWADDETCAYLAMALTIATDLSLNKIISYQQQADGESGGAGMFPRSECISARKALALDGFEDVDPASSWGRRLLRRRERIWLALFNLDRGVCLARGRPFTVPMSPLVETCDRWHISDIADTWDESIVLCAVLRRNLVGLIADIKATCDNDRTGNADGSLLVRSLKGKIDTLFSHWFETFAYSPTTHKPTPLPPYVEILVSHTLLSVHGLLTNHPTAPSAVRTFFHSSGLAAALNVMRAAVQGEGRLKSMPNNTAIMISFAACFALRLSGVVARGDQRLVASVRSLVSETADVLERIGSVPKQRRGVGVLFGRQLRGLIWGTSGGVGMGLQAQDELPFELLLFSAMSNEQIVEAINNASDPLETYVSPLSGGVEENIGVDWLDWFTADFTG